jgi:hypothetical protein
MLYLTSSTSKKAMAVVIIAPLIAQFAENLIEDIKALFTHKGDQVGKSPASHFQSHTYVSNTLSRKRRTKLTTDVVD